LEFRGHEGATAGVVEVEDEVFDRIGEEVVRHGWGVEMKKMGGGRAVPGGGNRRGKHNIKASHTYDDTELYPDLLPHMYLLIFIY
jgi:hypothetical protein